MIPADDSESPLGDPELREELRRQAWARLRRLPEMLDHIDDLVQECLGRAVQKWNTYDPAKATVAGWVHGIMSKVLMEAVRKQAKQPMQADDSAAWADTRAVLEPDSDRETLHTLLAKLAPNHREIVTLHHLEEWPHERIAAKLGKSSGATRVLLSRAMAELKAHAAKEGTR